MRDLKAVFAGALLCIGHVSAPCGARPPDTGDISSATREKEADRASLFALGNPVKPFSLGLASLAPQQEGDFGEVYGPAYFVPPLRFDLILGAIVPMEESGLAFGAATSGEDFGPGGMFGMRLQVGVTENVSIGGEIDFAVHDVDRGEVFFPGDMGRVYFMLPVSLTHSFGSEEYPVEVGFSVAPGVQILLPDVDPVIEDLEAFLGRFIEEDDFAAFTLRAAVSVRFPINWRMFFFLEASYDWAYGEAEVEIFNSAGALLERRADEIDASSINALGGISITF